ncbi:hypothetical protein ACOMHN_004172 [Nucella lapillus]
MNDGSFWFVGVPFHFKRLQFPLRTCFAMSINKAQGQSLKVAGLNFGFSHGQLYVGCSRVGHPENLFIYAPENKTKNIVYPQALQRGGRVQGLGLQVTHMCLMHSSCEVAAACFYLALKWSRIENFPTNQGIEWYRSINKNLNLDNIKGIANILMKAFKENEQMVKKILNPQKYREEVGRSRTHTPGLFSMTRAIPRGLDAPGTSRSGSPQPGPSHSRSQPGPSGLAAAAVPSAESSHAHPLRHRGGDSQSVRHNPYSRKGDHRMPAKTEGAAVVTTSVTGSTAGPTTSVSASRTAAPQPTASRTAAPQPTAAHHCTMFAAQGPSHSEPHGAEPAPSQASAASRSANVPPTKKLSLSAYHQRAEQRPSATTSQARTKYPIYPMHPGASARPAPPPPNSRYLPYPAAHGQGKKQPPPPPSGHQAKEAAGPKPPPQVAERSHNPELLPFGLEQGHKPVLEVTQVDRVALTDSQGRGGRPLRSPVKGVKKEGGGSVPNSMHLKEAKVMVQDLKDSQGKEKAMYANAEASRRRSISQSQEDDGMGIIGMAPGHNPGGGLLSQPGKPPKTGGGRERAQYNHSSGDVTTPHKTPTESCSQEGRKMAAGGKHRAPKAEPSGSDPSTPTPTTPIKVRVKRESSGKYVATPRDSSPTVDAVAKPQSHLKLTIRRTPERGSMHSTAAILKAPEEGLKMRLAMPGSGAEKHSNRVKHGMLGEAHQGAVHKPGSHPSSLAPQVANPSLVVVDDDDDFMLGHNHSRLSVQPQMGGGFQFSDLAQITPNVPENIFEPETPTDLNGGFGAPETPTADNMAHVAAHMHHLFNQQTHRHQHHPPHPHFSHSSHSMINSMAGMGLPPQPPLPPPLPHNPPPPPPPPSQ